jgi:hypothetical protein
VALESIISSLASRCVICSEGLQQQACISCN